MTDGGDIQEGETSASISPSTLERLRGLDDDAWHRMSIAFAPLVLRWVLRAGLNAEDAKDVVQEVFRGVAGNIATFRRDRPGDTFRGWLFSITKKKLSDFFRQRRKTPLAIGGSGALQALQQIAMDDDPEGLNPDDGMQALVQRVFAIIRCEFNEQDLLAFLRIVVAGERPVDVAHEIGCSVNSVYLAKSRILRRLRQELCELDD